MGNSQIFVVDIGGSKVSAALAFCSRDNRIFEIFTESAKRRAVSRNSTEYMSDLSDIISNIKTSLERKTDTRLKDVFANIDSEFVSCRLSKAAMALTQGVAKTVSHSELKRVQSQARHLGLKLDEEILHEFPSRYIVDSNVAVGNPLGLAARKLEVDLFLIVAKAIGVDSMTKILSRSGLKLKSVSFSGIASAAAILKSREELQNAVVIDIGALNTKIAIFSDGILNDVKVIHFAGNNISEAISSSLNLSYALAEELKETYSSVAVDVALSDDDIMIKTKNSYKTIKRSKVSKAALPEVKRLISLIKDCLGQALSNEPRIFVCGGTALLDGLLEALEAELSVPVVLGRPNVDYFPAQKRNNFFKNPSQATMVGLIALALKKADVIPASPKPKGKELFGQFLEKVKQAYTDYF
ncbi:MAG: rod shape-determining protein [Candidatus Omnitrophica bacterium]|nr:rod shape-determining protein [Candidatus Omnitrophota bacterium]